MQDIPKVDVLAAVLIFRLFYLLIPFAIAIVVVLLYERSRLAHAWRDRMGPTHMPPPPGTPGPAV
jgi:glycosyltransferase 2 family protein